MIVPVRAPMVAFFFLSFSFLFPALFGGSATQYPELEYPASSSTLAFGGLEPDTFPSTVLRMRTLQQLDHNPQFAACSACDATIGLSLASRGTDQRKVGRVLL
jgi:hypothetical protein